MYANNNILRMAMFILIFFISIGTKAKDIELIWETEGFKNPESVVYSENLNILFVSNVNGKPNEKDGNGFISIVSIDGKPIKHKWVENLNAPKGLAISKNILYVADIDELVAIDIDHGKILQRYKVSDAKFLNDVTIDSDGNVYVSDMVLNRIHRLKDGEFNIWIQSDELEGPNGLLFNGEDIVLASWGNMTDGFNTEIPGHLKRISIKTKSIYSIGDKSPIGNLDGVEGYDAIGYFVTDWMNGVLFNIDKNGKTTKLLTLKQGSADLEYISKNSLLIIPMMNNNKLLAYRL